MIYVLAKAIMSLSGVVEIPWMWYIISDDKIILNN